MQQLTSLVKSANTLLQYIHFRDVTLRRIHLVKVSALNVVMENDIPNLSKFGEVNASPDS